MFVFSAVANLRGFLTILSVLFLREDVIDIDLLVVYQHRDDAPNVAVIGLPHHAPLLVLTEQLEAKSLFCLQIKNVFFLVFIKIQFIIAVCLIAGRAYYWGSNFRNLSHKVNGLKIQGVPKKNGDYVSF